MPKTKTERQRKTPQQRAEEQLAVAERAVTRLTEKVSALRGELAHLEEEWQAAVRRRDYLAKHPDLHPATNNSTVKETTQP